MPLMGRPRKTNRDLPHGLFCYPGRNCFIQMYEGMPRINLKTRDRAEAKRLYAEWWPTWNQARMQKSAEQLASKLIAAVKDPEGIKVSEYAKAWREIHLPTLLKKKDGKPISDGTRDDYDRMIRRQVEPYEPFTTIPIAGLKVVHLKQFLSKWIGSPNFYNYMLSLCSRFLQYAVDEGILDTNPASEIERRTVAKRDTYMPDADYVSITGLMAERDARACDLLFLISHNPQDVLKLREEQVVNGLVKFTRGKTGVDMEIEIDDQIELTLQWLRDWKASQDIVSPYFVVYGKDSKRRFIGRPISTAYLSRRFTDAVRTANFADGTYTLRDVRPKALSDEFVAGGENNKGGHKTEEMKRHYRRVKLPYRAKNNLRVLR